MSLFGGGNKPGGLSINTGSANLFGNSASQPPPAGGLFGSTASTATSQPAGSSLFGTSSNTAAPSAGTLFGTGAASATTTSTPSLFGNTATANAPSAAGTLFGGAAAAKPAGGGLFGNTTPAATSAPAAGGLFGSATNTAAPAATGGLFGGGAAAGTGGSSLFGNKPATGGLFGGGAAAAAPAASNTSGGLFGAKPAGGSLFGNTTTTNTAATAGGGGGLFGNTTTGNTGGGLFGSSTANNNAQNQIQGLFGASGSAAAAPQRPGVNHPVQPAPQQTQRSVFSSSIGSYTASQNVVPGTRIDASNLRPTTRFADLHELLQQELERLDTLILRQQTYADECQQAMPAVKEPLQFVPSDTDYCQQKLDALQSALEADASAINGLKRATRSCADDAKVSFRHVSSMRTPASYSGAGGNPKNASLGGEAAPVPAGLLDGDDVGSAQGRDLAAYMTRQVEEMEKKLSRFRNGLGEVETYLQSVEAGTVARVQSAQLRSAEGGGVRSAQDQIRELAGVLREMEGGILAVAGKVGGVREKTQEVMLEDSRVRGRLGPIF